VSIFILFFYEKQDNRFYPIGVITNIIVGVDDYLKLSNPVIQNMNALSIILSHKTPSFIRAMIVNDTDYDTTIALYLSIYPESLS
jgi:hypothetical protein